MPTLRQVLGILRRAGVGPEEISIPTDIYRDVLRQVEEILAGEIDPIRGWGFDNEDQS